MIIPVKCFTYYCEEVRKRKLSKDMPIDKVVYLTKTYSEKTAEGIVLDELNLKKMCCRRHMLTHVDIE